MELFQGSNNDSGVSEYYPEPTNGATGCHVACLILYMYKQLLFLEQINCEALGPPTSMNLLLLYTHARREYAYLGKLVFE